MTTFRFTEVVGIPDKKNSGLAVPGSWLMQILKTQDPDGANYPRRLLIYSLSE